MLSLALKQSTTEAHEIVERHPSVDALITAREVHAQYLVCLYHIYSHLESALQQHAAHPALCYNYDPLLFRSANLEQDIAYFLDIDTAANWQDHRLPASLPPEVSEALEAYTTRLDALASSDESAPDATSYIYPRPPARPHLLLAHAYVRYMGDLSGGQAIRKSVAAAYGLPLDSIDGQRFYHFGRESSLHELKAFKSRFRHGLDMAGAELSPEERDAVLMEANHAFELNVKLFSSFATALKPARAASSILLSSTSSSSSTMSDLSLISDTDSDGVTEVVEVLPGGKALRLPWPAVVACLVLLLAVCLGTRRLGGQAYAGAVASS